MYGEGRVKIEDELVVDDGTIGFTSNMTERLHHPSVIDHTPKGIDILVHKLRL